MASLTLSVGPVTATKEADNTKAAEILELFVDATGGPSDGTNQEKAQHIVDVLAEWMVTKARREYRRQNPQTTIDWSA